MLKNNNLTQSLATLLVASLFVIGCNSTKSSQDSIDTTSPSIAPTPTPTPTPTPSDTTVTFVGSGVAGSADGTGTAAQFNENYGLVTDSNNNVFALDSNNHTIRKITPAGVVTTFAGTAGASGTTDGTGAAARFNIPSGITIDSQDNLYVADTFNHLIRKVTPAGVVTTFAGSIQGTVDDTGTNARFFSPYGITIDSNDNLFVVDHSSHLIRKVTPGAVVTTFAGTANTQGTTDATGTAALFRFPRQITIDSSDNLFVADTSNHTIRKITSSAVVTTFAGTAGTSGSADGTGIAATFDQPFGVAFDASGNLFVADTYNHTIRKITSGGVVTTFAGTAGVLGAADGTGAAASFNYPAALAIDSAGNLFVADAGGNTIRKLAP